MLKWLKEGLNRMSAAMDAMDAWTIGLVLMVLTLLMVLARYELGGL